jgi:site-specific DNA-methyltransferase (adenine-specific)
MTTINRHAPGEIRDAIVEILSLANRPMSLDEITEYVRSQLGIVPSSSIRSYLRLNTPTKFLRTGRGLYTLFKYEENAGYNKEKTEFPCFEHEKAKFYHCDCLDFIDDLQNNSIHAIVTDPPYGLMEYSPEEQAKLRSGDGGVWRIPPSFDGCMRSPLPRFTVLKGDDISKLRMFFFSFGKRLYSKIVPGGNLIFASNPLLSYVVSSALAESGFERRGEIIRLVMTLRGGDRPKAAHNEYPEISVMPRSMWEPWVIFRKPLDGRVQDNLRKWKTGGFRRPSKDIPFGDVIHSSPARGEEKIIANHPSLKPQRFMRQLVRAALPLGEGVIFDPFAGSGATLSAANAIGYESIGTEIDYEYYHSGCNSIKKLSSFQL